ncbi:hypothetical protein IMZ48_03255 [Candidatus Bathyarchaeota archaeon]|nr:hypothetical protein [Candidatus Bathyarchaeota archaeon]
MASSESSPPVRPQPRDTFYRAMGRQKEETLYRAINNYQPENDLFMLPARPDRPAPHRPLLRICRPLGWGLCAVSPSEA